MAITYVDATGVWSLTAGTTGAVEAAPVTITRVFLYPSAAAGVLAFTDASGNELFSITAGDTYYKTMSLDFSGEHGGGRRIPSLSLGTATNATGAVWLKKTEYLTTKAGL